MSVITAADIASYRSLTESLGFPDTYELLATTATPDAEGGSTETEGVIESGACSLTAGATRPDEQAVASRQGSQTPYVIELPYATGATGRHAIRVNGSRTFAIIGDALKDGAWGIAARVVCEERS